MGLYIFNCIVLRMSAIGLKDRDSVQILYGASSRQKYSVNDFYVGLLAENNKYPYIYLKFLNIKLLTSQKYSTFIVL